MTENEQPEIEETQPPIERLSVAKKNSFKERMGRFFGSKKGKVVSVFVALVVIAGLIYAIPASRYAVAGTFIKRNVHVVVTDSTTQKPVSEAELMLGNFTAKTDANGVADVSNVPAGEYSLRVTKSYYTDMNQSYEVPVFGEAKEVKASLVATGRQVVVSVTNKITKAALMGATLSVGGVLSVTDDKGIATMVLPADRDTFDGKLTREGYNEAAVKVKATDQADANTFTITPTGSLFYLSKKSGKIDVMKSNLDGTGATVVLKGTGNESDYNTQLYPSSDWKYLMLSARRDTSLEGQLYLIDANNGSVKLVDKGVSTTFEPVGWSGHNFIYNLDRGYYDNEQWWRSGSQAIKSYDAHADKLLNIAETSATGSKTNLSDCAYETIPSTFIVNDKLVYDVIFTHCSGSLSDNTLKKLSVIVVDSDGSNKKTIKEMSTNLNGTLEIKYISPSKFNIHMGGSTSDKQVRTHYFYGYDNGALSTLSGMTTESFWDDTSPIYRISPNSEKALWHESRDGKNTIFVGNGIGSQGKEIASESDYSVYGWFGDDYILLTKNSSELYISAVNKAQDGMTTPVKVANYHRAAGYWGYGGQ